MPQTKPSELVAVTKPLADLISDPANVRKHSEKNIEAIKSSLARFGQQTPIVVDSKGVIRKGNGTAEAAKALGWTEITCVVTDLAGAEATAYAIADNRTGELADWDHEALKVQLEALIEEDADLLPAAGFTEEDFDELVSAEKAEIANEALNNLSDAIERGGKAEVGEVVRFKNGSVLICCDPVNDLDLWRPYLTTTVEKVVPYPSVVAPVALPYEESVCLFIQPVRGAFQVCRTYMQTQYPHLLDDGPVLEDEVEYEGD